MDNATAVDSTLLYGTSLFDHIDLDFCGAYTSHMICVLRKILI